MPKTHWPPDALDEGGQVDHETPTVSRSPTNMAIAFGEAVLMMELPRRHSTPSEGGRLFGDSRAGEGSVSA
jgi:hypothetical protein